LKKRSVVRKAASFSMIPRDPKETFFLGSLGALTELLNPVSGTDPSLKTLM
jgi:hypothetical protein